MIDKALGLPVDAVIFDLEDGVPAEQKETARNQIRAAVDRRGDGPEQFVRVRPACGGDLAGDVAEVVRPGLRGLVLPKVESSDDVCRADEVVSDREANSGLELGAIRFVALIESARGLIQAPAIAASCPRLEALMFGGEDFALDLGILTPPQMPAPEHLYARSSLVVAAASQNLQAIDRVCVSVYDQNTLCRDATLARQLGFTGKALIHPDQIHTIHEVLTPTSAEIEKARQLVETFEKNAREDGGAVLIDGRMVDRPVVERARRMLQASTTWNSGGFADE